MIPHLPKLFKKVFISLLLLVLTGLSLSAQAQSPDSLWRQAQSLLAQGDKQGAVSGLQQAALQAQDADPERALALFNYRTELLQELQEQDRRLASAREAVAFARSKALGGPVRAKALELLGYALLTEKTYRQSLPLLDSAAALHQQGKQYGDAAFSICGQAINYLYLGKYDSMALALERSFALAEEKLPPEHEVFSYLSSLQAIYFRQTEDYEAARSYQQRVLGMLLAAEPIDSLRLFKQYLNIGVMYRDRGDLSQALVSYQRAEALAEKLNISSTGLLFSLYFNTASALLAQKNGAAAQQALDRCAAFAGKLEETSSSQVPGLPQPQGSPASATRGIRSRRSQLSQGRAAPCPFQRPSDGPANPTHLAGKSPATSLSAGPLRHASLPGHGSKRSG
jgi:tetratricopeptide (TPR) repeat protein